MEIILSEKAKDDLEFWKKSGNVLILKKIRNLIESITETPFEGLGKPEPLKFELTGFWSRRITKEHRLVYTIENEKIIVIQLRFHY